MRADRKRPGLLYAGTEYGMYISYDDGANWRSFQLNLPEVPITDLTIKNNDLIVATQGRAFWIIDDLTLVQENNPSITDKSLYVFPINSAYRIPGADARFAAFARTPVNAGANPPNGAIINFFAKNVTDSSKASISIIDITGKLVKTFSTESKENKFDIVKGMNKFVWNLRYPNAESIDGMILWNGVPSGIIAAPGEYSYKLKVDKDSAEGKFTILPDPNYKCSPEEYKAQFLFLQQVLDKFNEVQKGIKNIRSLRNQINDFVGKQGKDCPADVKEAANSITKKLTAIEEVLYQTKAKSGQDVLNYPIRLNDKLSGVFDAANSGNMAPSKQAKEVYASLAAQCDEQLNLLKKLTEDDIAKFNQLVREKALPVIK